MDKKIAYGIGGAILGALTGSGITYAIMRKRTEAEIKSVKEWYTTHLNAVIDAYERPIPVAPMTEEEAQTYATKMDELETAEANEEDEMRRMGKAFIDANMPQAPLVKPAEDGKPNLDTFRTNYASMFTPPKPEAKPSLEELAMQAGRIPTMDEVNEVAPSDGAAETEDEDEPPEVPEDEWEGAKGAPKGHRKAVSIFEKAVPEEKAGPSLGHGHRPLQLTTELITRESYDNEYAMHDKETLIFYDGDGILVTEAYEEVPDYGQTVGTYNVYELFEGVDGDQIFIRNYDMAKDFEIVRFHRTWSEVGPEITGAPQ